MKKKETLKWGLGILFIISLYALATYIDAIKTYDIIEMSGFLTVCGTLIQGDFSSYKPGPWDYFVVLLSAVIVLYTLYYSIKYMIKPSESEDHLKFQILENNE